jgi:hypothetical protein
MRSSSWQQNEIVIYSVGTVSSIWHEMLVMEQVCGPKYQMVKAGPGVESPNKLISWYVI